MRRQFRLQYADSDYDWSFVILFFATPLLIGLATLIYIGTAIRIKKGFLTLKKALFFATALAGATIVAYLCAWFHIHPKGISYTFDYGQSPTWHEVQFSHTVNGREIEGPWVGRFPLKVRFPDLNRDGYPDIRVTGDQNEVVEYVYLPENDGKCFWHPEKMEGLYTSYPPAGIIWP